MKITEELLDKVVHQIESNEEYFGAIQEDFFSKNEDFISYLTEDIFKNLTEDEMNLLVFILVVINQSLGDRRSNEVISIDDYMDIEESNWELYEKNLKMNFRDRLNPFFETYDEEDAFAFIEDSLQDDEEDEEMTISNVGRDIIWNVSVAFTVAITED